MKTIGSGPKRYHEIKDLFGNTFNLQEGSIDTILTRKLKKLLADGYLAKEDKGHQKVFYSLSERGRKHLTRIDKILNYRSLENDLVLADEKISGNLLNAWMMLGKQMIEHIKETDSTLTLAKYNSENNKKKTVLIFSFPDTFLPSPLSDSTKEDFYYLPYALVQTLKDWNDKEHWAGLKKRLTQDGKITRMVQAMVTEEKENPRPNSDKLFVDTLTT
jgi:DNA-binding PadR family transcriptional regulator